MSVLFKKGFKALLWSMLIVVSINTANAQDATDTAGAGVGSPTCHDAKLFSQKIITDVCWSCMFPIRLMGAAMGGGSSSVPSRATSKKLCVCYDNNGVPEPGMAIGMWEPARLIELVTTAGCSPVLGGTQLPGTNALFLGTSGDDRQDKSGVGFYHYHYFAFPLLKILDMFSPVGCAGDSMMDLDIMYLSEVDPTWNNDVLAFFTNPEAAAVANLPAQAACMIDAAASALGKTIDQMWWCAGSWGGLYPLSGNILNTGFVNMTSLSTAKAIAALHRRGLAHRTMGDDAMCKSKIDPMLPKSMYKINMFSPVAEGKKSHVIGETTMKWGVGRMIPVVGEDAVYMIFKWSDCCLSF